MNAECGLWIAEFKKRQIEFLTTNTEYPLPNTNRSYGVALEYN